MAEAWEYYYTEIEEQPASVFLNLGLAESAPVAHLRSMAFVRFPLQHPDEDGLSTGEEKDALAAMEDQLDEAVTASESAMYVGRVTSGGQRELFYYSSDWKRWTAAVAPVLAKHEGYEFETGIIDEPDWATYFNLLYPPPAKLETIHNRRICAGLEEQGDALDQPREMDHFASFPSAEASSAFIERAGEMGFALRGSSEPDATAETYGVQLYREDTPSYDGIDEITMPLFELAEELGGTYEGWEAPAVCEGTGE